MVFRCTANPDGSLSEPATQAFHRDGVVLIEDFVTAGACDRLRARILEIIAGLQLVQAEATVFSTRTNSHARSRYFEESGDQIRAFFEEEAFDSSGALKQPLELSINKIGHAMHDLDPVFEAFSHGHRLDSVARSIGLSSPKIVQSMYIFKQPGIGGEVLCHQDSTYLYTRPMSVVGLWFALEDAHRGNGCLAGLPGEHRKGLKQLFHRGTDGQLRLDTIDPDIEWDMSKLEYLEVSKGTMIVFDGCFPHLSEANRSPSSRHAYTLHAMSGHAEYPADNWLQRDQSTFPFRGFL